jgi:hypothetical protein
LLGRSSRWIADELDVRRENVRNWANGEHPRHAVGERLLALWMRETGQPREKAPIISEYDFRA